MSQRHRAWPKLLQVACRIHTQPTKSSEGDPPKLYSVHAPEVQCIAKGKAHKQYEFGVKVGIVSTNRESFVLAAKSLPGNAYDSLYFHFIDIIMRFHKP
jgi:transposase, IS5 family